MLTPQGDAFKRILKNVRLTVMNNKTLLLLFLFYFGKNKSNSYSNNLFTKIYKNK